MFRYCAKNYQHIAFGERISRVGFFEYECSEFSWGPATAALTCQTKSDPFVIGILMHDEPVLPSFKNADGSLCRADC